MPRRRRFISGAISTTALIGLSGCTQSSEEGSPDSAEDSSNPDSVEDTGRIALTSVDKNITISRYEQTRVNFTARNEGSSTVSQPINVTINGEPSGKIDIELEPNQQIDTHTTVGPVNESEVISVGENNITISSADDMTTTTVTMEGPTTGELIESFTSTYAPATYEKPSGLDAVEDVTYTGRINIPILLPHTAQVQYEIDLTPQEGYETIPLNCYFISATSYINLRQRPRSDEFKKISSGTQTNIAETNSFSFIQQPGMYFLVFESANMGRESAFSLDFESVEYLNYNDSCIDSKLNVPLSVLLYQGELIESEDWNVYYHVQYNGESNTTYQLESKFISSDDQETITQQRTQIEGCETNFLYNDDILLNLPESGERIINEFKIFDESGETLLAEKRGQVRYIYPE